MGSQTAWVTKKNVSLDGKYIDLLVKRELANDAQRITFETFEMQELPAIAAIITLPNRTRIAVASLHLPHMKEAAPLRKRLCRAIMEQLASQQCEGIILAGNFNMRKFEDMCGGGWVDAWKAVTGSNYRKEFTWDGRENLYHGHDKFQFHCRFDRCYVKGDKLRLRHFDLIGNHPVNGREGDYLSDHYGIVAKLDIGSTGSTSTNALPSVNRAQNTAAIRAARLERFEANPVATNQRNAIKRTRIKKQSKDAKDSLIDLSKDSDDEDENTEIERNSSSFGEDKFNEDDNMVDLTEGSDDEVEILEVASASNDDGFSVNADQNGTGVARCDQSGVASLCKSSSKTFAPRRNDDKDCQRVGTSQSANAFDIEDDEKEVLKPRPGATNDDNQVGHIQDADETKAEEEEVSEMTATNCSDLHSTNNQLDEHSIDMQMQLGHNNISESAIHSNPAPPSLFYASSTASTPIRDNRDPERVSKKKAQAKRKKLVHLSNSSSDEDDFAIMRAKLAKKKEFKV